MKNVSKLLSLSLLALLCVAGCKPKDPVDPIDTEDDGFAKLTYPEFPTTPSDKDSWEYMDPSQELTIDWFVNVATWNAPTGKDMISNHIKEKTGITINFSTPVEDNNQKLSTMIAGGDIPDVITLTTSNNLTASLAQQGYVYDINTLSEKWAPTLKDHLPDDVWKWWSYGNGKTYGVPNHYYSYSDVGNERLQPNGGMMVRRDLFEAWQNYAKTTLADASGNITYTGKDGNQKSVVAEGYITTPEGFQAASQWALANYAGNGDGDITCGLQLSQFGTNGCTSIEWLCQFFAVPFEDEQGNYVYRYTAQGYQDAIYYLNDLYNTTAIRGGKTYKVISDSNFTSTYDQIGGVIAGAKAFATLVTPQDYQMHFLTAMEHGYDYVTLYITNEAGDAPVLGDIRGYGYFFNMISTKCKRPDLVIKLFDYLTSPEGQRLVTLGVEGVTWNWNSDNTEIVHTQEYLNAKADLTAQSKYGLMGFDVLINYQYYDNVQPRTNNGKTVGELYRTNLKRPLTIYTYDYNAAHFVVDATNKDFAKYNTSVSKITNLWVTQLPKIIKAKTIDQAKEIYSTTITTMQKPIYNLDLITQLNNEGFAAAKAKLGLEHAWPGFDPNFNNTVDRTHPNGDLSLYRTY